MAVPLSGIRRLVWGVAIMAAVHKPDGPWGSAARWFAMLEFDDDFGTYVPEDRRQRYIARAARLAAKYRRWHVANWRRKHKKCFPRG